MFFLHAKYILLCVPPPPPTPPPPPPPPPITLGAKNDINRVEQFEANERQRAERDEEEGDSDDDEEALEFRRLEAGAYTQQRLAVVMVVIAAHSSAVAQRVSEKLHQVL